MKKNDAIKRINFGVVVIIVLSVCLCITTFTLIWGTVSVDSNLFQTGRVMLNLNDGAPVINEQEYLFEPGMRVVKEFFIENLSTTSVYYRLYFSDIEGNLADVMEISISCGGTVLYSGKISEMTREKVMAAEDVLQVGERRTFSVQFHYPKDSGNETQGQSLTFTFCADGVQTKNNPNKLF